MHESLIPVEIARKIPHPYRGPGTGIGATAHVRLAAAWLRRRWYVILFDPATTFCWTKYIGPDVAGYMGVHLATLEKLTGPQGERVERDPTFQQQPLEQCEPDRVATLIIGEEVLRE